MNSTDLQAVSQNAVNVLLISPYDEDHRQLQNILDHSTWQQHGVRTQAEALDLLGNAFTPVVICEGELPDGSWQDVLSQLRRWPCPPLLVVTSRFADERLWSEVLNLGAYNVLAKPFNAREVFHVVSLAWRMWKAQWEHERPLARTA